MKSVSIYCGLHSSNISYYDGRKVHYVKMERVYSTKHWGSGRYELLNEAARLLNFDWRDIEILVLDIAFLYNRYYDRDWYLNHFRTLDQYFKLNDNIYSDYCKDVYIADHHFLHSLSYWPVDQRQPDVAVVIDGRGNYKSWSVYRNNKIVDKGMFKDGSIGKGLADAGSAIGIKGNELDVSGKVMAYQSSGSVDQTLYQSYQKFSAFGNYKNIFFKQNGIDDKNWIATVHKRAGELVEEIFEKHCRPEESIFYSGGVALNVVWNTGLKKKYKQMYIVPHCGDEGLSIGGIKLAAIIGQFDLSIDNFPYCQSDQSTEIVTDQIIEQCAEDLANNKIVAWYQQHGEIGPRALGNRSILLNPMLPDGKRIINQVKNREQYRPFGASVLQQYADQWFDDIIEDKYMLYTAKPKYDMPAITHIDNTCRVQTVTEQDNPTFYKLLTAYYQKTGCPVLLNTSLNLGGKPIASKHWELDVLLADSDVEIVGYIGNERKILF